MLQLGVNLRGLCGYQANSLRVVTENGEMLVKTELFDAAKELLPLDYIFSCVG